MTLSRTALDVAVSDGPHPGPAQAWLTRPDDDAPHPGVLLFMDAVGPRPRLQEMADRIASEGFAVLVPHVFWRAGRAPVVPDLVARLQGEDRAAVFGELRPHMLAAGAPDAAATDTAAWVAAMDAQPGVAPGPFATVGYCMGGALALRAAAQLPDRVVAAASFHGGGLGAEGGPHLVAPQVRAEVYVAHADEDPSMPPQEQQVLERALTDAGVTHTCEVYDGAPHGFTMSDLPSYDASAEQRHWTALLALLHRRLG